MTSERAKELLQVFHARGYGALCGERPKYPDVTREELEEIKAVWKDMPGHTSMMDATRRIANVEAEEPRRYTCREAFALLKAAEPFRAFDGDCYDDHIADAAARVENADAATVDASCELLERLLSANDRHASHAGGR